MSDKHVISGLRANLKQQSIQFKRIEAENDKYLDCLNMVLGRDCCSAINSPYCDGEGSECDCVWERVCQTVDPERWKEVQALKEQP